MWFGQSPRQALCARCCPRSPSTYTRPAPCSRLLVGSCRAGLGMPADIVRVCLSLFLPVSFSSLLCKSNVGDDPARSCHASMPGFGRRAQAGRKRASAAAAHVPSVWVQRANRTHSLATACPPPPHTHMRYRTASVPAHIAAAEAGLSPLWAAIKKLDLGGVNAAVRAGGDLNERDAAGDTPLLMIARAGHYKYPPSEIPAVSSSGSRVACLLQSGYKMEFRVWGGCRQAVTCSYFRARARVPRLSIAAAAAAAAAAACAVLGV